MRELVLFTLFLLALGIGFYLGRRQALVRDGPGQTGFDPVYVKGLNLLLNEDDQALDLFVDEFEVTPETLDTHLALGNQLRRKGEFSKATKVHQNLLARPSLTQTQRQEAQLELARDFVGAGLLDRAESLFQDLIQAGGGQRNAALKHLIEIYQDEREWHKAIAVAEQLAGRRFGRLGNQPDSRRAHFCCELAQECLERRELVGARDCLNRALKFDSGSVRASLLLGEVEYRAGHWHESIKALHQVAHQDPNYLPETLELLCHAYRELGQQNELRALLQDWQGTHPSSRLVIKLAEQIRWSQDDFAAADLIAKELEKRPTMKLLNCLVDLQLLHLSGRSRENLKTLKELVDQVLALKPSYQCHNCGFTGQELHWLCPRCKHWGSIKAIRGVEGD